MGNFHGSRRRSWRRASLSMRSRRFARQGRGPRRSGPGSRSALPRRCATALDGRHRQRSREQGPVRYQSQWPLRQAFRLQSPERVHVPCQPLRREEHGPWLRPTLRHPDAGRRCLTHIASAIVATGIRTDSPRMVPVLVRCRPAKAIIVLSDRIRPMCSRSISGPALFGTSMT